MIMTDEGVDSIILPICIFKPFQNLDKTILVKALSLHRPFQGITGHVCSTCRQTIHIDECIMKNNGSNLELLKIMWEISEEGVRTVITGKIVLDSPGYGTRFMLELLQVKDTEGSRGNMWNARKQE